ncbi:MAG: acetoin utilization protein AcuC [Candidatus Thorarchaeota archaeon]|nr:MAG: acetoin utilization protein AcuC [Candidatus Thorarchaeota archaeon]RLI59865.1 MAG: acetoin utilization protein AcuC [Candidatus Thorarchaeota archaeon]
MTGKTALYNLDELLAMDGIDELSRLRAEPNPFWNRARLDLIWSLPKMAGMLESDSISLEPMREATRDELLLFHDPSYVETLELFSNMGSAFASRFGLDTEECPIFSGVERYASLPVGATIDAVMGVASGKFKNAMSFVGGFHHAMESKASGFCYYNDAVIAIKKYKQRYPKKRVLYLDTDVHHGDGTQAAFYSDPDVLTISMHELSMGFYPETGIPEEIGIGEGKGYSVNIPFPPLTDDFLFWNTFEDVVVPIWLAYKPDLVIWEVGADAHQSDPLADLMLTYDTYRRMSLTVRQLVHLGCRKLVTLGGGGYNPIAAARIWTMVLADMAEILLPPTLPPEWIELAQRYGKPVTRGGWTDRPTRMDSGYYSKAQRAVSEAVAKLKMSVFPILGIE